MTGIRCDNKAQVFQRHPVILAVSAFSCLLFALLMTEPLFVLSMAGIEFCLSPKYDSTHHPYYSGTLGWSHFFDI